MSRSTIRTTGQSDVELEHGVTFTVDFTVEAIMTTDYEGDSSVPGGLNAIYYLDNIEVSIDRVALDCDYEHPIDVSDETKQHFILTLEPYAQQLIDEEAAQT